MIKYLSTTVFILFLLISCRSTEIERQDINVPDWVMKLPVQNGKLFAVGIIGPTYFKEDLTVNASDNARKELAKALAVRVQTLYIGYQKEKGFQGDEIAVQTVVTAVTDTLIKQSQILETWVDEKGIAPNSKAGMAYALAVIDVSYIKF